MEVILKVLIWFIPVLATVLILRKVFPGLNKKNVPNSSHSQLVEQSVPVTAINHEDTSDAAPASSKKAVPVKVKPVAEKRAKGKKTHE